MPPVSILRSSLVVLVALAFAACERTPTPGATRTGAPRLVALSPAVAVILRDLGAADLLVGRHGFDAWSDPTLTVCGDQSGVDLEALSRVQPTHLLIQPAGGEIPARLQSAADENRWSIHTYPLLTLADIKNATLELATVAGKTERAAELAAEFEREWPEKVVGGVSGKLAGAGRVLLLFSPDPPTALGPGSFHHQILERIGATPAIANGRPFITLDAEGIARLAPDCIVLIQPRDPDQPPGAAAPADVLNRLGVIASLNIPALKNNRIALIDDPLAAIPGTNMLAFTRELRRVLTPWSSQ